MSFDSIFKQADAKVSNKHPYRISYSQANPCCFTGCVDDYVVFYEPGGTNHGPMAVHYGTSRIGIYDDGHVRTGLTQPGGVNIINEAPAVKLRGVVDGLSTAITLLFCCPVLGWCVLPKYVCAADEDENVEKLKDMIEAGDKWTDEFIKKQETDLKARVEAVRDAAKPADPALVFQQYAQLQAMMAGVGQGSQAGTAKSGQGAAPLDPQMFAQYQQFQQFQQMQAQAAAQGAPGTSGSISGAPHATTFKGAPPPPGSMSDGSRSSDVPSSPNSDVSADPKAALLKKN